MCLVVSVTYHFILADVLSKESGLKSILVDYLHGQKSPVLKSKASQILKLMSEDPKCVRFSCSTCFTCCELVCFFYSSDEF